MKGPIGKFIYTGPGLASINSITRRITTLFMICAGSGITPIFQVLRAALEDPNDTTRCIVLDSNRLEEDILCKSELDSFAEAWMDQLRLVYTLTKPSNTWKGRRGRIDAELIKVELEDVANPIFLICGPEPLEKSVRGVLKGMGWQEEDMVFF
jgi:nitrate reductase (NAD(P)H)